MLAKARLMVRRRASQGSCQAAGHCKAPYPRGATQLEKIDLSEFRRASAGHRRDRSKLSGPQGSDVSRLRLGGRRACEAPRGTRRGCGIWI